MGYFPLDFIEDPGRARSARALIPIVLDLIKPASVVDVGCGLGVWLSVARECGIEDILGVDGDYVPLDRLEIPSEQFLAFDLKNPLKLGRQFDLAISLEVGQYLPVGSAETFVDSLVGLAPVILFSAAAPFQGGGPSHVNERWPDWWADLFSRRGYVAIDCIRRQVWRNDDVKWWYAQNTLVFADRAYVERHLPLREEWERTRASPLSVIHPRKYLLQVAALSAATSPEQISSKLVFAALLFLAKNAVRLAIRNLRRSRRKAAVMADGEGRQRTGTLVQNALDEAGVEATLEIAVKRGVYIAMLGHGGSVRTLEFYADELLEPFDRARDKARALVRSFQSIVNRSAGK